MKILQEFNITLTEQKQGNVGIRGMLTASVSKMSKARCPSCHSEAVYKYGRTGAGKQRFLCLMCKRQFASGTKREEVQDRPICPECGKSMHLYMRNGSIIRFRCSDYPVCRTFKKEVHFGNTAPEKREER